MDTFTIPNVNFIYIENSKILLQIVFLGNFECPILYLKKKVKGELSFGSSISSLNKFPLVINGVGFALREYLIHLICSKGILLKLRKTYSFSGNLLPASSSELPKNECV